MKDALTDQTIARLRHLLSERIGYVLPQEFRAFVVRQVEQLMADIGVDDVRELTSNLGRETSDSLLWQQFISRMTIGESYLFRNPNHMQALRAAILPTLLNRARERPVTIWSAGCARGEEPYTLAILLHELDPKVQALPISIVATDIDRGAIESAKAAAYGKSALRQTPYFLQRKYFRKENNQLVLTPSVAQMVRFTQHHLSHIQEEATFPRQGFDLILCRNVLMYLRQDFRERAGQTLARWLAPDGALIPGQVERIEGADGLLDRRFVQGTALYFHRRQLGGRHPLLESLGVDLRSKPRELSGITQAITDLEAAPFPPTTRRPVRRTPPRGARRLDRPSVTDPGIDPSPASDLEVVSLHTSKASSPRGVSPQPDAPRAPTSPATPSAETHELSALELDPKGGEDGLTGSELYDTVRSLMYSGKIEEARACCKALISSNPLEADHYCLLALVHLEDHNPTGASEALRRAIYCNPDCLTAFYLWWLIGVRYHNGRWERMGWAKRHLRRLMAELSDDHPVPLITGVTAGDIRYLMHRNWSAFES